jgi:hypothetical protein
MTDAADSSLGEMNLNNVHVSELAIVAMPSIPSPLPSQVDDQQSCRGPTNLNDATITSEVLLIAMEGVLRDSMEMHRRELKRLKRLARREEEKALVSLFSY